MKNLAYILICIFGLITVAAAQTATDSALENPIDTAIRLYQNGDLNHKEQYFHSLLMANRYQTILDSFRLNDDLQPPFWISLSIVKNLKKDGDKENAKRFVDFAYKLAEKQDFYVGSQETRLLAQLLIEFGRLDDAEKVFEVNRDDSFFAIAIARAYAETGKEAHAKKLLDAIKTDSESSEWTFFEIAKLYFELGDKVKALHAIEPIFKRKESSIQLMLFLGNHGEMKKADEIWQSLGPDYDDLDKIKRATFLRSHNRDAEALKLLNSLTITKETDRNIFTGLVNFYLLKNQISSALRYARMSSTDPDSYEQQQSFMTIADKLIEFKRNAEANQLVNYALKRAARVGETHRSQDSIGASPMTRKIQYLTAIRQRLIKLNKTEDAFKTTQTIFARNDFYAEYYAKTLTECALAGASFLTDSAFDSEVEKTKKLFETGDDYYRPLFEIRVADVYAKRGFPKKAVALINEALNKNSADSLNDDVLLEAGVVFELNHLKADDETRRALGKVLEEN